MAAFDPIGALIGFGQNVVSALTGGSGAPTTEIPKPPDLAPLQEAGEALVAGQQQEADAELAAKEKDKRLADEFSETVQADKEGVVGDIEDTRTALRADEIGLRQDIGRQRTALEEIPGAIKDEFDSLRAEFDVSSAAAIGRGEKQRVEALAGVYEGQSAALQSAVAGIQGNINAQVAEINSNPNLTQAQKQQMVSQVRLSGASALAPAVGETVLQFNELAATTAVAFGQIAGNLEGIIVQEGAALAGAAGSAFASAQVAVGELTNQLVEIQLNSTVEFAMAQNQLLATRSMAENSANDLLLQNIPNQGEPWLDITGALATEYAFTESILSLGFQQELGAAAVNLQLEAFKAQNPPFPFNLIDAALGFIGIG